MLKNEEIRQKQPFLEKGEIILKLGESRVVAFAQFTNKREMTIVTLWTLSTKSLFLTA